jgi:hypothetical protein
VVAPPGGRQHERPTGRAVPSRAASPPEADGGDDARLGPREQARIDDAVVTVSRRGRGPVLVAALVVAAFLAGLVRPWDWVGGARDGAADGAADPGGRPGTIVAPSPPGQADGATGPASAYQSPTCAYPSSWRTASLQLWAGREARVWSAAEATPADGPVDPAIVFHPLASDVVEAIGWCAPVTGPERPPLAAAGTLFRLEGGVAVEVPVDRLEPAAASALGELWVPPAEPDGRRLPWPEGRYVIRLATASGGYERYLGLEVGVPVRGAAPSPSSSPVPSPSSSPAAAESPSPSAGPG